MSFDWLNYHHLHYFWVVAHEGSISAACKSLHLSQPTISSQLRQLERNLKGKLFERQGRGLQLTELGKVVLRYADEIFTLGKELTDVAQGRPTGQPQRLTVGISEAVAKLVVFQLLLPALRRPEPIRITCREGHLDELLNALGAFELDLVLSDTPLVPGGRVKAFSHLLGECGVTIFGSPAHARRYRSGFPTSLSGAPMLMPVTQCHLRRALDQWFDEREIRPIVTAEFQDTALMKVFGQEGIGLFPGPTATAAAICRQYGVKEVGRIDDVRERYYAISAERRLKNPAVVEISRTAKTGMFAVSGSS